MAEPRIRLDPKAAKKLERLLPALEARSAAAAQAYRDAIELAESLRAQAAAAHAAIGAAAAALEPGDLQGAAAFGPWAAAQRRRVDVLLDQARGADAAAEAKREALARAHGEARAVKTLT